MTFYDELHEMYRNFLKYVPETYYTGSSVKGFEEKSFVINNVPHSLTANELFGKEFFYIMPEGPHEIAPASMALCKEIVMENINSAGYTKNKEQILKRFLVHDSKPNVYLYNSHIIYDGTYIHVQDFTKDMLFNISTTFGDARFDSIRFLLDVHDNDKLEYICVRYRT